LVQQILYRKRVLDIFGKCRFFFLVLQSLERNMCVQCCSFLFKRKRVLLLCVEEDLRVLPSLEGDMLDSVPTSLEIKLICTFTERKFGGPNSGEDKNNYFIFIYILFSPIFLSFVNPRKYRIFFSITWKTPRHQN
jgi:hypothetical protein